MKKKVAAMVSMSALMLSSAVFAQNVSIEFADPHPGEGIGYEWSIKMTHPGDRPVTAEFTRHVGAKSSYEPSFSAPNIGWNHTSDWVALQLTKDSLLTIEVNNQRGVQYTTVDQEGKVTQHTAGRGYFPGVVLYEGYDNTSTEEHSFNPLGNFWATQLDWITANYDRIGQHGDAKRSAKIQVIAPAGLYSINIGGANALYCEPQMPCYNGRHGYKATITAEPVPVSNQ